MNTNNPAAQFEQLLRAQFGVDGTSVDLAEVDVMQFGVSLRDVYRYALAGLPTPIVPQNLQPLASLGERLHALKNTDVAGVKLVKLESSSGYDVLVFARR